MYNAAGRLWFTGLIGLRRENQAGKMSQASAASAAVSYCSSGAWFQIAGAIRMVTDTMTASAHRARSRNGTQNPPAAPFLNYGPS